MNNRGIFIFAGIIFTISLGAGSSFLPPASAQESGAGQEAGKKNEIREPQKDYNQRAMEIYEYKKAAKSGPERGEEIYYYKCWYCHNEYAKGAPQLKGLYSRPKLISGQPVNDDTVKEKIRNGGPGMAGYKYELSDEDLNDLASYLRTKCCWDSENPPKNPRFRAK